MTQQPNLTQRSFCIQYKDHCFGFFRSWVHGHLGSNKMLKNVKFFNQKLEMLRKNSEIGIQMFCTKCQSVVSKNTILKKSERETMEKGVLITGQTCQSSAVSEMIPRWCTGRRAHCPMFWCSVYLEHLFQDRASRFSSG